MKISVITVCLNSEKTIENTIRSVITQKYNEIEYIVIDGESKDKTIELINKYMYHKPLLGVCLGAQAIAVACGVPLFNLESVMHGKKSEITI